MKTYLILILALASALLAGCDKESGADDAQSSETTDSYN